MVAFRLVADGSCAPPRSCLHVESQVAAEQSLGVLSGLRGSIDVLCGSIGHPPGPLRSLETSPPKPLRPRRFSPSPLKLVISLASRKPRRRRFTRDQCATSSSPRDCNCLLPVLCFLFCSWAVPPSVVVMSQGALCCTLSPPNVPSPNVGTGPRRALTPPCLPLRPRHDASDVQSVRPRPSHC